MGFTCEQAELAVQIEGENMDRCVQFLVTLAESKRPSFPSKSTELSFDSVVLCVSTEEEGTLPPQLPSNDIRNDCSADEEFATNSRRLFGQDRCLAALEPKVSRLLRF